MSQRLNLELDPADTERLANLCGPFDEHLKQIEGRLQVDIFCRGNLFTVQGESHQARATRRLLQQLYKLSETETLTADTINLHLQDSGIDEIADADGTEQHADDITIITKRGAVRGRGPNQKSYLRNISKYAVNFGIGPAGTGKTYLAVASAVAALQDDDAAVRSEAMWALGMIESDEALPGLLPALQDDDADVRSQAVWALGMIESAEAVPGLLPALQDADHGVRSQTAWALGMIQSGEAVPGLVAALQDADEDVRSQAAWALDHEQDRAGLFQAAQSRRGADARTEPNGGPRRTDPPVDDGSLGRRADRCAAARQGAGHRRARRRPTERWTTLWRRRPDLARRPGAAGRRGDRERAPGGGPAQHA